MSDAIKEIILAASIPSTVFTAIVGLVVWYFKRSQDKKDKEKEKAREKREKDRAEACKKKEEEQAKKDKALIEFIAMSIKATNASIAMGEAIGTAVARIPDAHCNGDMHEALEHARKVKHEMREFMTEQGLHHIFDD